MKLQTSFEFLAILSIISFLILSSVYLTSSTIRSFKNLTTNTSQTKIYSNFSSTDFVFSFQIPNSSTFKKSFAYVYLFSNKSKNVSLQIKSNKFLNISFNSSFLLFGNKLIVIPFTPIYPGSYNVSIRINNQTFSKKVVVKPDYKISIADFSSGFGNGISANILLFSSNVVFLPIVELSLAEQKQIIENVSFSGLYNIKKDFYLPSGIYNLSLNVLLYNKTKVFSYSTLISTANSTSIMFSQDSKTIFNFSKPLQIYKVYYTRQCTVYVNDQPWVKCGKDAKWSYRIFSPECYDSGYGIDYVYCIYLLPIANEYNLTSKSFEFFANVSILTKEKLYNMSFFNTNKTKVLESGKEVGNATIKEIYSSTTMNAIALNNFSSTKLIAKDNLLLYQSALQNLVVIADSINGKRISSDYEIKNAINVLNNSTELLLSSQPIQTNCNVSTSSVECNDQLYFKIFASISSLPQMQFFLRNIELYVNK